MVNNKIERALRKYLGGEIMKGMKKYFGIILLLSIGITGFIFGYREYVSKDFTGDNLIRLHVIANSDAVYDQKVKLMVRDDIIALMTPYFKEAGSSKEARTIALEHLPEMQEIAAKRLGSLDMGYSADVEIGAAQFPTKSYGNFVLPAGEYEAVRVVLGDGKGKNWWCVLFPPLCFVDISNTIAVDVQETIEAVEPGQEVEVRFKILELWDNSRQDLAQLNKNLIELQ